MKVLPFDGQLKTENAAARCDPLRWFHDDNFPILSSLLLLMPFRCPIGLHLFMALPAVASSSAQEGMKSARPKLRR
jgi:hypothetical protein